MKRIFTVTGMSYAACSARVEKAVRGVPGVEDCAVSLLTDEMSVEGPADDAAVVAAVEAAGYGAAPAGPAGATPRGDGEGDARSVSNRAETRALRIRLASSLALLGVLMYATMGHMMLGWPLPPWFTQPEPNHVAMGLAQLLLSGTGDVFAGAYLRGLDALDAAALAADVVCAAIEATPDSHWYGVCFERTIPMLASRLA